MLQALADELSREARSVKHSSQICQDVGSGIVEHSSTAMKTIYGRSTLHCYSFGPHEEDNILCVEVDGYRETELVRIQGACYTGQVFKSTDCDCDAQLSLSMELIHEAGGLVVYTLCDGRGAGLLNKVKGLALGDCAGLDTYDAYRMLGIQPDPRDYIRVLEVLNDRNLSRIRLLTNNPLRFHALSEAGMEVERVSIEIPPTPDSIDYLETKRIKFGHLTSTPSIY